MVYDSSDSTCTQHIRVPKVFKPSTPLRVSGPSG